MKKEDTDKSSGVQKDESKEREGGLKFQPQDYYMAPKLPPPHV